MTRKKWITLGILVMASSLLTVTVVVASAAQSSEAEAAALSANERFASEGLDGNLTIAAASPVSTSFTYQGQLKDGGSPVNGSCEMAFRLYDQAASGGQVGPAVTMTVPITNGLFTVGLDFGAVFTGTARWLGTAVQCPGDTDFATLSPCQALTPVPYALALPGLWTQQNGISPNLIGGYWGNWVADGVVAATIGGGGEPGFPNRVTGDYGTVAGGVNNAVYDGFATVGGGDDNQANGEYAVVAGGFLNRALWTYATVGGGRNNTASNTYATVSGGQDNSATHGAATVSGGQNNSAGNAYATVGGGYSNAVSGHSATIGGGYDNTASANTATVGGGHGNIAGAFRSTIGGGYDNTASGDYATVGGGGSNVVTATYATIGGGEHISVTGQTATVAGGSWITATGDYAAVGGGRSNAATHEYTTIGGGWNNVASVGAATVGGGNNNIASNWDATVGGGLYNTASGYRATVGGGDGNTASDDYATIPGGRYNTADGDYSFAAGRRAQANNQGCFVWGDSTDADITCSNNNRAVFRSSGGFYIYTNSGLGSGMYLSAGGSSWNAVSDRTRKENFAPVDTQALLTQLAEMPISTWNYKSQAPAIRHIGPMAQDFNALLDDLGGEGQAYINTLDADGVALAAIQGLYAQNQALEQQNADLEARVAALETALANGPAPTQVSQLNLLPWAGILLAGAGLAWAFRRRDGLILFNGGGR